MPTEQTTCPKCKRMVSVCICPEIEAASLTESLRVHDEALEIISMIGELRNNITINDFGHHWNVSTSYGSFNELTLHAVLKSAVATKAKSPIG